MLDFVAEFDFPQENGFYFFEEDAVYSWNTGPNWEFVARGGEQIRDVLDAVRTSVNPKVIDCPDPRRHGRNSLDGVAKDGIQLIAIARVTVRANINRLVGGAGEETILARVGEGIVCFVGVHVRVCSKECGMGWRWC